MQNYDISTKHGIGPSLGAVALHLYLIPSIPTHGANYHEKITIYHPDTCDAYRTLSFLDVLHHEQYDHRGR